MPHRLPNKEEKSPVERVDFEGLQLDTRARENKDPFLDDSKPQGILDDDFDDHLNYINEKQTNTSSSSHLRSPVKSIEDGISPVTPPLHKSDHGVFASASPSPVRVNTDICGLRRRHFWTILGLTLAIIITAAIVGGVVGGLQARNAATPPSHAPIYSANGTLMTPFVRGDVLEDSPLAVVSYDAGGTASPDSRQTFRVYYQSISGNITEAVSNGMTSWQTAKPIFTDATNYTGLATVTYLNGSQQQGSIFYVGGNGLLQEKRKVFNSEDYWEPGTLNSLNIPMVGNITLPYNNNDPPNLFDSFRMAAVYSSNFKSGPGIRLFYHALDLNGTSFLQEVIWIQSQDKWTKGAEIKGAWPNSHLAATVDESTNVLRLFLSAGNNTLQEAWSNVTDSPMKYASGTVNLPNFLDHNSADVAAVSVNGSTSLFYYATAAQSAQPGIHELSITGDPGSKTEPESFTLNEPLVYNPALNISGATAAQNQYPYVPIGAAVTVVPGLSPQVLAFWTETITGDPQAISGYRQLDQLSRVLTSTAWPNTQPLQIPLAASP